MPKDMKKKKGASWWGFGAGDKYAKQLEMAKKKGVRLGDMKKKSGKTTMNDLRKSSKSGKVYYKDMKRS